MAFDRSQPQSVLPGFEIAEFSQLVYRSSAARAACPTRGARAAAEDAGDRNQTHPFFVKFSRWRAVLRQFVSKATRLSSRVAFWRCMKLPLPHSITSAARGQRRRQVE